MTQSHAPLRKKIDRRTFLKSVGIGAAGTLATSLPQSASAQQPPVSAMRTLQRETFRPASTPPVPSAEVIALNRMAFGPRPGDLEAFRALGSTPEAQLEAFVDQQLNPEAIDDSGLDARLAEAGFSTLDKPLEQLWADHVMNNESGWGYRMLPVWETERATFMRAIYSRRQLVEVLADFWHNHFNVFGWDYWVGPVFVHYDRDVIRAHLLGNFREFLEAVATSTAMLFYLDNYTNSDDGPNENYARELFELHTLGAENYLGVRAQPEVPGYDEGQPIGYVDEDVYEAARCFTGWRVDYGPWEPDIGTSGTFLYHEPWHDRFQKHVLGLQIPSHQAAMKDGRDVLDALAAHPGTGRHIARKLCRRFISDDPPERVVNEAAAVFTAQKDAPDQLKQVVRAILLSNEFRTTWGEKIKRPFEVIVSALRATAADLTLKMDDDPSDTFIWFYDQIGQPLFQWRAPDGYPDIKAAWSGTTPMLQRWRMCSWLVDWRDADDEYWLDIPGQTPASIRSASELTDFWIERLLGWSMNSEDRQEIVEFMAQGRNPDYDLPIDTDDATRDRLRAMVGLILMSPDFQWR